MKLEDRYKVVERSMELLVKTLNQVVADAFDEVEELVEDKWLMLYQKILVTLPLGAKAEFQRDCESSMVNGLLAFSELKKIIIAISRKAAIFQPVGNQVSVLKGLNSTEAPSDLEDKEVPSINAYDGGKRVETRSCYYCGKQGHLAKNCFKKKRDAKRRQNQDSTSETSNETNEREAKTDGRRSKNRKQK